MKIAEIKIANGRRPALLRRLFFWISPLVVSLLVHLTLLYFSDHVRWGLSPVRASEQPATARVVLKDPAADPLRFQDTDKLDSVEEADKSADPPQEIEYRPVSAAVDFFPKPKGREALDLIRVPAATVDHSWIKPGAGAPSLYTGSEKLVGSFSRHIQVLREGGLDVVFVFDATVSMARYLKRVKYKIANLANTYKKLVPTCRIGLVAYRDRGEAFITRSHPLTYGVGSLKDFLHEIDAVGGGDREEAVEEALRVAIDEMAWNERSKKIILLMGDAPPREDGMAPAMALIRKFREQMGGRLAALDTRIPEYNYDEDSGGAGFDSGKILPGAKLTVMDEFITFADIGGGECARLADEEKVVKQMLVLVFGARWEVYLDEFMKNL